MGRKGMRLLVENERKMGGLDSASKGENREPQLPEFKNWLDETGPAAVSCWHVI